MADADDICNNCGFIFDKIKYLYLMMDGVWLSI
jgi:hypothetical protein